MHVPVQSRSSRVAVGLLLLFFSGGTNRFRIDSACGWHKPYLRFRFTFILSIVVCEAAAAAVAYTARHCQARIERIERVLCR